jgi:hypothetical protein
LRSIHRPAWGRRQVPAREWQQSILVHSNG